MPKPPPGLLRAGYYWVRFRRGQPTPLIAEWVEFCNAWVFIGDWNTVPDADVVVLSDRIPEPTDA